MPAGSGPRAAPPVHCAAPPRHTRAAAQPHMPRLRWIRQLLPPVVTDGIAATWRWAADQVARRRIAPHRRLHLACGGHLLPGWANVDLEGPAAVIKLDLTRPLPVASQTIDCIYAEHFIEHIERPAAQRLLRECHRVLVPAGVLRLSTPSLAHLVAEYQAGRTGGWADLQWHPATPAQLLNEAMRCWGHRFLFDAPELEMLLHEAGFARTLARGWRASEHAALAGLECRPYKGELIYEGVK